MHTTAARRISAALALGLLSAALLLAVPSTATATTLAPPPPVEDVKGLPSQVTKGLTSAGGIGDKNIQAMAWLYGQVKETCAQNPMLCDPTDPNAPPTKIGYKPPAPLSPPKTNFIKAGGGVAGAFFGGFAIGDLGLGIYGGITGENPLDSSCGTPLEGVVQFMYMTAPECIAPVYSPNSDVVEGATATIVGYGTFSTAKMNDGYPVLCGPTTSPGTGRQYNVLWSNNSASPVGQATSGDWYKACGSVTRYLTGYISRTVTATTVRVLESGVVVASADMRESTPNPVRTPSCTIDWEDGTSTTATGSPYNEADGIPLSTAGMGCKGAWDAKPGSGSDVLPRNIEVESEAEGGAKTQIVSEPVPEYTEQQKDALTAPSITEGLKLWKGKTSCMTWAADCASWWSNTEQGTTPGTGEYRCTFNTKAVDLAECGVYRHTFDTRTSTPVITDPTTGEDQQWSTKPEQGNTINPGTGPGTGMSPGQTCMAEWASAPNPIDWVLHPIKCALVWAFVPRAPVINGYLGTVGAGIGAPGLMQPLMPAIAALPGSQGCEGIPLNLDLFGTPVRERLLYACDDPFRTVATVTNAAITLTVTTMVILAVGRFAAATFGYVGPGGGFDQAQRSADNVRSTS